jgi:hypothetical protein
MIAQAARRTDGGAARPGELAASLKAWPKPTAAGRWELITDDGYLTVGAYGVLRGEPPYVQWKDFGF